MDLYTVMLLGLALTMDAAVVSLVNGMTISEITKKQMFIITVVFAVFQCVMTIIGYYAGVLFLSAFENVSKYISFAILAILSIKMIIEGIVIIRKKEVAEGEKKPNQKYSFKQNIIQGVATSIDALFAGFTLTSLSFSIFIAGGIIGAITFVFCLVAVIIGVYAAKLFNNNLGVANIVGGIVLMLVAFNFIFSFI